MLVNDIRNGFLEFFRRHGHGVLPSSSLVPHSDPTLMFANAGMNQFKNIFTGVEKAPTPPRAATSQKCVRAGGKHNDLDNVGYTARHHTFFEMLGNFSFGDYFKEHAIDLAWELLTKDFSIPAEKLCVTVYHDDDVAWNHWKKITGFADHKIIRIPTADNFWSMGDTGPCGPCSEIFYDHGDKIPGGPPGSPEADGDRFVEIWNLVFMQYEQVDADTRINLPKPSIDTGMGLERLTAVLQGVHDNYEIDLFRNLIADIKQQTGNGKRETGPAEKVIADHLRSSCFLVADGVLPSNEGRGYVLRRIMRRAMRYAHQLGCKEPLMHLLVPSLIAQMGKAYPELARAQSVITETLKAEEERFKETLGRGLKLLEEESASLSKGATLSGDVAFKLYDTYGFPLDLTQDILRARDIGVDTDGFDVAMEEQRERARGAWSGSGEKAVGKLWFELKEKTGATEFLGYEHEQADAKVLAIVVNGESVQAANGGDSAFVILNRTPFYGESGGQVGDVGEFHIGSTKIADVTDTAKPVEDLHVHAVKVLKPFKVADSVIARITSPRRDATRANHSATHLLHKALREILGEHVTQKGSLVAPDRLRFDFSHGKALTPEETARIEQRVNDMVWRNTPVRTEIMSPEEAIKGGALALFGEKYGDSVRVLSMGDDDGKAYSIEFCGGTHVRATGDIGLFKIISEGAVAAGIRRIEAVTREGAFAYLVAQQDKLKAAAEPLKIHPDEVPARVQKLQDENKKLAKELAEAKKQLALGGGGAGAAVEKESVGGVGFVARVFDDLPPKELRGVAEDMLKAIESGVAVVATGFEGKASLVVAVTKPLCEQINAVALVQAGVEAVGGKGGGGRPEMAQGGGPEATQLQLAIAAIKAKIAA